MTKSRKAKAPKPQPVIASKWPDLFIYYRGQREDGGIQENNMLMRNVGPLVTPNDFALVQNYIMKQEGFVMVRIVHFARAEGIYSPPEEKKK